MSKVFPRVTKCTFQKYGPSGTIQNHDAQVTIKSKLINVCNVNFALILVINIHLIYCLQLLLLVCASNQHHQWKNLCVFMVLDAISHICDPDEFHMVGWYHVYATCKSTNHSKKTVDKVSFYIFEYNCNEYSNNNSGYLFFIPHINTYCLWLTGYLYWSSIAVVCR